MRNPHRLATTGADFVFQFIRLSLLFKLISQQMC